MNIAKLREALHYDPLTGHFIWAKPRKKVIVGTRAGRESGGRRTIKFAQVDYLEHRLAWAWMIGEWPVGEIDHIDCNPLNNKWSNLRLATKQQNLANTRPKKCGRLGLKGVRYRVDCNKFEARITVNYKKTTLGLFATKEEAAEVYISRLRELYGEFARAA